MKVNARFLVVLAIALVCVLIALTAYAQIQKAPIHTKWEYKDGANLQLAQMNALGEEGWELTAVVQYDQDHYYLFKRPK